MEHRNEAATTSGGNNMNTEYPTGAIESDAALAVEFAAVWDSTPTVGDSAAEKSDYSYAFSDPSFTDITKAAANGRVTQTSRIYRAPDHSTFREWWPGELNPNLVYGVDFGVRPDRTEADEDAYIEYAPGAYTRTGWEAAAEITIEGPIEVTPNGTTVDEGWGRLLLTHGALPRGLINTADVEVATLQGLDGATTGLVDFSAEVEADDVFTLALFPGPALLPTLGSAPDARISGSVRLTDIDVLGVYTLPAWRYWIPGAVERLPLRQRQRNDGLGMSTVRWRGGTSRQRSIRWAGYL